MTIDLIDVSNHQGNINWDAVASHGIKGAFIKASEGNFFRDGWFARNWSECKRVGLWRGAYHFARPSRGTTAAEEAYYFLDTVMAQGLEPGDALVLDNEDEKFWGDVVPWAKFWFEIVESIAGFNAIHYTGPWYIDSRMLDLTSLQPYALWLAAYPDSPDPKRWPKSFREVDFWQYTSSGSVHGVVGNCDKNWFRGTQEDLNKYGKPTPQNLPDWANLEGRLSAAYDKLTELESGITEVKTNITSVIEDFKKLKP